MNKQQELAEQIAEKHLGKVSWKLYGERQKQQILAAIVEAMDAPAKEGTAKISISFEEWLSTVDKILRTLNYNHTELDKKSWKLLYDDGYSPFKAVSESEFEGNLTWKEYVKLRNNGVYHEIILQPSYNVRCGLTGTNQRVGGNVWRDKPAAQPLQPSIEEKKEDLVASDNNSSTVPCVTPLYDNNSIQQ
jgi:hypothetical protein